jgi:hypothetical protein
MMRRIIIALCFMLILSACTQKPLPELMPGEPTEVVVAVPESEPPPSLENDNDSDLFSLGTNHEIYDFAVLSEDDFPRGEWTINQLIAKYGTPNSCNALYSINSAGEEWVSVRADFPDIYVWFWAAPIEPKLFSFQKESREEGVYDLSESDFDIERPIVLIRIRDSGIEFPYGIKIGEWTKTEIINAYGGEEPYTLSSKEYNYHFIAYNYDFFDETAEWVETTSGGWSTLGSGFISYYFDDKEVLKEVEIQWWYSDV